METLDSLIDKLKPGASLAVPQQEPSFAFGFENSAGFAMMQRAAQLLAASTLVPQQFRGNVSDCVIALDLARRLGASPLAIMQSLHPIHGRPAWSAQFIIACLNSSGKFSPLRFDMNGEGLSRACIAWATDRATGDRLDGPQASIAMAKAEGWYDRKSKDGSQASKWPTMPELMLRYRAAAFFGRLYAPDIMMGMQTREEAEDSIIEHESPIDDGSNITEKLLARRAGLEIIETPSNEPCAAAAQKTDYALREKIMDSSSWRTPASDGTPNA